MSNNRIERLGVLVLLVLTFFSFIFRAKAEESDQFLKVYFLDVGQGDAQFIETAQGHQILIDGGPDDTVLARVGEIMPVGDRTIDLVILTHPHADHVAGLVSVLNRYDVDTIIESEQIYESSIYAEWNKMKKSVPNIVQAQAGIVVNIGHAKLYILNPSTKTSNKKLKNTHDGMVVARLEYGDQALLLTGDMESDIEHTMIASGATLSADFLKVGHHGSKTSTSDMLLDRVRPKLAFIGVGAKNRYGHPTQEVTNRLDRYGIRYYRTDQDGTIRLLLDGQNYVVTSQ